MIANAKKTHQLPGLLPCSTFVTTPMSTSTCSLAGTGQVSVTGRTPVPGQTLITGQTPVTGQASVTGQAPIFLSDTVTGQALLGYWSGSRVRLLIRHWPVTGDWLGIS